MKIFDPKATCPKCGDGTINSYRKRWKVQYTEADDTLYVTCLECNYHETMLPMDAEV